MKSNTHTSTDRLTDHPASEVCLRISAHSGTLADDAEFAAFIEHGAAKLTPRSVGRLVSELPEIREKFSELDDAGFPQARVKFEFLAEVVEGFALQLHAHFDVSYIAALEGAFALQYFHRAIDLIPDSLGPIGYTDDITVAQAVLARHAAEFEQLAYLLHYDWAAIFSSVSDSH